MCKLVTQCARHLEVRRHESVVDNDTDARPLMSNLHNGSNVDHLHCWVCRRFNPDNLQCRQSLTHTQTNTVTHWVCRRLNPDNLQCRQSLSHTQTNTVTHWFVGVSIQTICSVDSHSHTLGLSAFQSRQSAQCTFALLH